jgi:hypothetical protein
MWCARIDHIIESEKNLNPCRDLVCETHAVEISKLGFCLNHHKLAESDDMCEDCLSSFSSKQNFVKVSQNFDFFPWMKEISMIDGVDEKMIEKAEEGLKCSCCGVNFDNRFYPPCIVINPSMNILDYEQNSPQKQNLIKEGVFFSEIDHHSDQIRSDFALDHHENQQKIEEKSGIHMLFEVEQDSGKKEEDGEENCACSVCDGVKETMVDDLYKLEFGVVKGQEKNLEFNVAKPKDDEACDKTAVEIEKTEEIPYKHLEFFIHGDDCSLIPVELVESTATENENQSEFNKVVDEGFIASEDFILDFGMTTDAEAEPLIEKWHISGDIVAEFSCQENKNVYKVNDFESDQLNYRDVRFSQTDKDLAKDDNVEVNIERMMNGYGDGELGSYVSLG